MFAQRRRSLITLAFAAIVAIAPAGAVWADDLDEANGIVEKARISFNDVVKTKEYDALRAGLKSAKGVLIFPSILKGGLFVGGAGGTGVLLVRGEGNA